MIPVCCGSLVRAVYYVWQRHMKELNETGNKEKKEEMRSPQPILSVYPQRDKDLPQKVY